LCPGELIYVSAAPAPAGRPDRGEAPGEARLALVMVRAEGSGRADGSVRLVQDYGRPTDPSETAAPPAPIKRGRGRPPGSRSRKADPPRP
jgi:hypothetical protein